MKLFYIKSNLSNKVVAISEFKSDICQFFVQNSYNFNDYSIYEIRNKKKINKMQRKYLDLTLEPYDEFIIRYEDVLVLGDIIKEYRCMMNETINNLESILKVSDLGLKDIQAFNRVIKILKKNKKKKNIEEFINIHEFIIDYYNIPSFRNQLKTLRDDFEFKIYKED